MARKFMKGNEVLAEAAIRAGCRFFSGYPITPQSEIIEYMSWRMPEVGGRYVQAESEIAGICMAYGASAAGMRPFVSSSGPGFTLKHEGISYIASAELPCVIVDVQRYGTGLGDIFQGQSDYWQAVKNGGHGDYRCMVLAPASIQEAADLVALAFDKAEEYRNPVILLTDASQGQMMEPVSLPEIREHDPDSLPWAMRGKRGGEFKRVTSTMYYIKDFNVYIKKKYDEIAAKEQRFETFEADDAEVLLVAYGISSRVCQEAVELGRSQGVKLGLIRPISLWPFPKKPFEKRADGFKGYLTVELSALGQIGEDVLIASRCAAPVYASVTGDRVPTPQELVERAKNIIVGKDTPHNF